MLLGVFILVNICLSFHRLVKICLSLSP
jgi:hypothetical protein